MQHTQPWKRTRPTVRDASGGVEQPASRISEPASSAAQPASAASSTEWPTAVGSSTDRAGVQTDPTADEDPLLTELKERQRKRAIEREAEREAEEQRPSAKPKATEAEQANCGHCLWQCCTASFEEKRPAPHSGVVCNVRT